MNSLHSNLAPHTRPLSTAPCPMHRAPCDASAPAAIYRLAAVAILLLCAATTLHAQTRGTARSQGTVQSNIAPATSDNDVKPSPGTLVDQVVAIVNGELILESDVQEDRRFAAFTPLTVPVYSRDAAVERLIDRDLILQQAKLQPGFAVSREDALKQITELRKELPACKAAQCDTDAGWEKFVHDQGFSMDELITRWQERMEVLKFIEQRFRSGILISKEQIQNYYNSSLLPEYGKRNAKAPPLAVLSDRIQEILLQQQVTSLLGDWLKTLKAEGTVRVMRPGEVQP